MTKNFTKIEWFRILIWNQQLASEIVPFWGNLWLENFIHMIRKFLFLSGSSLIILCILRRTEDKRGPSLFLSPSSSRLWALTHIYIISQIVHHNPCFNLFVLYNNSFDNQGSEINKNDIFLRFDILSFTKTFFLLHIQ